MIKRNYTLLFVILLTGAVFLNGVTRVYQEKTGSHVTTHKFEIQTNEGSGVGFSIHLQSKNANAEITQTFELDEHLSTWSWTFDNPEANTHLTASRENNKIFMQGKDRGKSIRKTFKVNDLAWNQTFNIGLEKFVLSSEQAVKFWAIGTSGPGNMKITKFSVKKRGIETLALDGQELESVYVTISLSGLLSMFWKGHYWYRKSDGHFLRYKGKNGPGQPVSVMELVDQQL